MFSKNNTSWFRNIFVFALVSLTLAAPTLGDTYTEYTPATLTGDMTSETEAETPEDRSRTKIGIGEKVECSIASCTWEDKDCKNYTEIVYDTIGDRVWGCSSGGTVDPAGVTSSDTTTLTADMSPDSAVYVWVDVYDTPLYYDDTFYIRKDRTFEVIAPSYIEAVEKLWDAPVWTNWSSGDRYLAAHTYFKLRIQPTSVSFYRAAFQENFDDGETDTWPNGTTYYGKTGTVGPMTPTQANTFPDAQGTWFYNSEKKLFNGSVFEDFFTSFSIPYEYEDDASGWTYFDSGVAQRSYYESDRTTTVGVTCCEGGPQGPWQGE